MRLGHDSCLLADELVLLLLYLLLGDGLPSAGLRLLPLLMSAPPLYGEADVHPRCHRLW
jgi:hypothetical protein